MEEGFPILDSTESLGECMDTLNKSEWDVCIVLNKGIIYSILDSDDLIREYIKKGSKEVPLKKLDCNGRFAIIKPETDIAEIIYMMKEGIEYFIVKSNPFVGLITKNRIAEENYNLFSSTVIKRGIKNEN